MDKWCWMKKTVSRRLANDTKEKVLWFSKEQHRRVVVVWDWQHGWENLWCKTDKGKKVAYRRSIERITQKLCSSNIETFQVRAPYTQQKHCVCLSQDTDRRSRHSSAWTITAEAGSLFFSSAFIRLALHLHGAHTVLKICWNQSWQSHSQQDGEGKVEELKLTSQEANYSSRVSGKSSQLITASLLLSAISRYKEWLGI